MDASVIQNLLSRNQPFRIETTSGRGYDVQHRDFVSFSLKRTSISIFFEENGEDHFAIVPLDTVTAAIAKDVSRG
jgi:hypothetical protein